MIAWPRLRARPESQVVAVLGMHRSGTSALAGCLEEAGVFLGKVRPANRANPRGNRENRVFIDLHRALLRDNGGSWDRPPAAVCWQDRHRRQRNRIIRRFSRHPVWGFKDPRALLCLEGWLEALPALRCVGIFRHPLQVARSLERRNGFPVAQGFSLWLAYNRRLLAHHDRLDFPLLSFDDEPREYLEKVQAVTRQLAPGLAPERIGFFDPALRHAAPDPACRLPEALETVYRELCARAV